MEDIILDIFLHLPVKSLTRCKCLSKKWNHIISYDTSFHQSYLSRFKGSSPLMLGFFSSRRRFIDDNEDKVQFLPTCTEGYKLKVGDKARGAQTLPHRIDESLSFIGREEIYIVASSKGLLLCCLEEYNPMTYYICNPITEEWVGLPTPNMTSKYIPTGFICNGNYPCLNLVNYKVVRGLWPNPRVLSNSLTIEIFSSESFEWKVLHRTCPSFFHLVLFHSHVFINEEGVVHWLALTETPHHRGVIVFDQRKERLQLIAVPGERHLGSDWLSESGGLVLYAQHDNNDIEIWMLDGRDDCSKKWSLKHRTSLAMTMENHPELFGGRDKNFKIIRFHPWNPLVLFIYHNRKIACYDVENSRVELVCDVAAKHRNADFFAYIWPTWPPCFP